MHSISDDEKPKHRENKKKHNPTPRSKWAPCRNIRPSSKGWTFFCSVLIRVPSSDSDAGHITRHSCSHWATGLIWYVHTIHTVQFQHQELYYESLWAYGFAICPFTMFDRMWHCDNNVTWARRWMSPMDEKQSSRLNILLTNWIDGTVHTWMHTRIYRHGLSNRRVCHWEPTITWWKEIDRKKTKCRYRHEDSFRYNSVAKLRLWRLVISRLSWSPAMIRGSRHRVYEVYLQNIVWHREYQNLCHIYEAIGNFNLPNQAFLPHFFSYRLGYDACRTIDSWIVHTSENESTGGFREALRPSGRPGG